MSILFFDGFDYYGNSSTAFGPGGRHWDQGSGGQLTSGRFGGQALVPVSNDIGGLEPTTKTLPTNYAELIVGFAMSVTSFTGIVYPFLTFMDHSTPQCSLWVDPTSTTITMRTGRGNGFGDTTLGDSGYVPPLDLWFYLEVGVTIGNPGGFSIYINGTLIYTNSLVQTQQSGSSTTNQIQLCCMATNAVPHVIDDLYVLDPLDLTNNITYLGEVRVQTQYPDAEGYEDDFLSSTSSQNYTNVDANATYAENGHFNYSGTVNAIDEYTIANFTIAGTIFAVQSNLSFRKDDVGNRTIAPLLRTASVNYLGSNYLCFSSYTYAGAMWEINPNTTLPWLLTDLNNAEFGIKVIS